MPETDAFSKLTNFLSVAGSFAGSIQNIIKSPSNPFEDKDRVKLTKLATEDKELFSKIASTASRNEELNRRTEAAIVDVANNNQQILDSVNSLTQNFVELATVVVEIYKKLEKNCEEECRAQDDDHHKTHANKNIKTG